MRCLLPRRRSAWAWTRRTSGTRCTMAFLDSLEAFARKLGRAGRNPKEKAACAIVFTDHELAAAEDFLSPDLETERARQLVQNVKWDDQGDASRVMYLHFLTYPVWTWTSRLRNQCLTVCVGPGSRRTFQRTVPAPLRSSDRVLTPWPNSRNIRYTDFRCLDYVPFYTVDFRANLFVVQSRMASAEDAEQNWSTMFGATKSRIAPAPCWNAPFR